MAFSSCRARLTVFLVLVFLCPGRAGADVLPPVDLCVYGATASGVIAAVTARQLGKSVLLIEPGRNLGGMTSGGLGWTDIGNKAAIGGLALDFYYRIGKAHGKPGPAWTFEPSVAENVFKELVRENGVTVLFEHRIVRAEKNGATIQTITLEHAPAQPNGAPAIKASDDVLTTVAAAMFLDCSYEGDLLARAGVKYHVGRESVDAYGEPHNGIREKTPKHQFLFPVDPYVIPGDPKSGLLPLIQPGNGGTPGAGDSRVQAYNFRLCLTRDKANQLPIPTPPDYDPARYEILARHVEASVKAGKGQSIGEFMHIQMVVPEKTDINNNGAVSTDYIGFNWNYPEADYATRAAIWTDHIHYTQGFLRFLATSDRIPQNLREQMQSWGLCKDEYPTTGGWPHQLYVREARRMIGRYVVTEKDCDHATPRVDDAVGLGAYNMDSHNVQRLVQGGVAKNEGDVQVPPAAPYAIPYRALTPKGEECTNLIVPVCLSASHIAYGSARMEPVFMVLGESSAVAACLAIDEKTTVQSINVIELGKSLSERKQILKWIPATKK